VCVYEGKDREGRKGKTTAILLPLKQVKTRAVVLNPFNLNIKIWIPV